jgi:SAM-dependent methyltransferase
MQVFPDLTGIVCCPRCRCAFVVERSSRPLHRIYCSNSECRYASAGFPVINDQPILIDFANSIFDEDTFLAADGHSVVERDDSRRLLSRVGRFALGNNQVAEKNCTRFLEAIRERTARPRVLIVGGGAIGSGAGRLYSEPWLKLVGTDVYVSPHTVLVADGHRLPFCDGSFDGVWVQAVLEHVLDPWAVVAEIHRVLREDGVVYAETPFMQQVHEGAYDFTRFTLSGHRWLFRAFHHDASGTVAGAGMALIWSLRYFVRAVTGSARIGSAAALAAFWVRYFDGLAGGRPAADAAFGVFFFGRKAMEPISPKEMLAFYAQQ